MRWQHEVSADWLRARNKYLTATDIVKLWPSAKKWEPGKPYPAPFVGLWFEKHSACDPNPVSFDSAARGHCMEPFAVLDANRIYQKNFHHWDDVIVTHGSVGFSPDAMDIPQPVLPVEEPWDSKVFDGAREIMEVKCFLPYHHGQCVVNGMEEEQLMQVAMAFVVLPQLDTAHVLYYCPGAFIDVEKYVVSRVDAKPFIERIEKVVEIWEKLGKAVAGLGGNYADFTEEEINKISMKTYELEVQ